MHHKQACLLPYQTWYHGPRSMMVLTRIKHGYKYQTSVCYAGQWDQLCGVIGTCDWQCVTCYLRDSGSAPDRVSAQIIQCKRQITPCHQGNLETHTNCQGNFKVLQDQPHNTKHLCMCTNLEGVLNNFWPSSGKKKRKCICAIMSTLRVKTLACNKYWTYVHVVHLRERCGPFPTHFWQNS